MQLTRKRHLKRGSALIYTGMLSIAIATVVVSTAQLNQAASSKAERQIDVVKADESESGVVALVQAKCNENTIALPATWNFNLNGQTQTVSVTDASATQDRCYAIETTVNGVTTRKYTRMIAGRQTANPLYFALWMNSDTDLSGITLTTTNSGHVFCRGGLTLSATSNIDGEVSAVGSLADNGATISKNGVGRARNRPLPTITRSDYETAAAGLINVVSNITGITFLPALVGQPYNLKYYRGNTDIGGNVSGKGTAYIEGTANVVSNVAYTNAAARAVIIVEGDLNVSSTVTRMDGLWFVMGNVNIATSGTALSNTKGNIIAYGQFNCGRDLTIGGDTTFWTSRNEGTRHRAPGFWPTADTGLFR